MSVFNTAILVGAFDGRLWWATLVEAILVGDFGGRSWWSATLVGDFGGRLWWATLMGDGEAILVGAFGRRF